MCRPVNSAPGREENWAQAEKVQDCRYCVHEQLKGLGYIVQMIDSDAKVLTSMLDVQLKII